MRFVQIVAIDCPVMSGFFHAFLDALEESLNDVLDSIPTVVIAQLCRAFFMHLYGRRLRPSTSTISSDCPVCRAFFMHKELYYSYNEIE